jgi:hypothetical protein
MDKQEAIAKIEELKTFIENCDKQDQEFVTIDYSVIPKDLFDKYGVKPFKIMKRKMRNTAGQVWNNINYFDARKKAEKLGYRLPNIREMLMLLEFYKFRNKIISKEDKEFLGIEELSYDEEAHLEWIENLSDCAFVRGGTWPSGAYAGAFTLNLYNASVNSSSCIGFRLASDLV